MLSASMVSFISFAKNMNFDFQSIDCQHQYNTEAVISRTIFNMILYLVTNKVQYEKRL